MKHCMTCARDHAQELEKCPDCGAELITVEEATKYWANVEKYEKLNQISAMIYGWKPETQEFDLFMPATDESDAEEFLRWVCDGNWAISFDELEIGERHGLWFVDGLLRWGVGESKPLAMTLAAIRLWDGVK